MELRLHRKYRLKDYSIGKLYINGEYFCDTLEDADRNLDDDQPEWEIVKRKVADKTAIPYGTYYVNMDTVSPKFANRIWAQPYGGKIPRILGIKGFNGVLIHPGTTAADTSGCILVGKNTIVGKVTESTATFRTLMNNYLVPAMRRDEGIILTIHQ